MAFCIDVTKKSTRVKYNDRITPYFSEMNVKKNELMIFSGEFHSTKDYFLSIDWEKIDTKDLLHIRDSFLLVKVNKKSKRVSFLSSKYGIERMYYYFMNDRFIISDDFWEIVNLIKPNFSLLDIESIEECMNGCYPILDGTFIKNLYTVMPGCRGYYDIENCQLNVKQYFEFQYNSSEDASVLKAVASMDKIINDSIKKIKQECGNVRYGFALSGGLDSRIIPHYLQMNGIHAKSFIIGDVRPNYFFLSGDHKKARKLADIFNIKLKECVWDRSIFLETIQKDIANNPLAQPQFFKGQRDCDFDVLITGGNGYSVGSTMPKNINDLNTEELVSSIRELGRDFKPNKLKNAHIQKAFEFILKKEITIKHHEKWYDILLTPETESRIQKKYCDFVNEEKNKGKTNVDIYEEYFHNILGARNKFGGFESLLGEKRSFSVYMPHILDETFRWPLAFLENRLILKKLIIKYIPEVSMIKEQKYEGNIITKKVGLFEKIYNIVEFIIRGNGSEMVNSKFKKCKDLFLKDMKKDTKWFYRIFPINNYLNRIMKHDNKYALMKIWKMKLVIDKIETEEYKEYISDGNFTFFIGKE